MLQELWNAFQELLGLGREDLSLFHTVVRTAFIYVFSLILVRIGNRRFLGNYAVFDAILGVMLGSMLSRAINGSAPFLPTLGAGAVLIGLHWVFAAAGYYFQWFDKLIKGGSPVLIENGELQQDNLRHTLISHTDLLGTARSEAHIDNLENIREARLERSGEVSFIPANSQAQVLEVTVEPGVQTIRIRIE